MNTCTSVKELRKILGWTQEKMAKYLHTTQPQISYYERYNKVALWNLQKLIKLALKHDIELELEDD